MPLNPGIPPLSAGTTEVASGATISPRSSDSSPLEMDAERFQILFVFRAELFFWRDQRSWKFRVSDHAIKGCPSGREDNTPEYDAAHDRMNSVSQRNQTGNAGNDQREDADRQQHNQRD